jgi:stage II sporulation protein D
MGRRSNRAAGLLLALLAPGSALAEEEVRISIAAGRARLTVEAEQLAVYDADRAERLGWAPGVGKLVLTPSRGRLGAQGTPKLTSRAGPKGLILEAPRGVRVDGRLYLGRIEVDLEPTGRSLIATNRLPIETYLLGIVGSEMSPSWPLESLKAQAVAARTYALQRRMMMRAANRSYDLESTVLSQVYQGADRIRPSVVTAVAATRGEVIAFHHRLTEALFHSTCGGRTVSARDAFGSSVPYLTAQSCGFCADSNHYRWKLKLGLDKLSKQLASAGLIRGKIDRLETTRSGLEVWQGKTRRRLSAKKVRAALGYMVVLSDRFSAKTQGKEVAFEGKGFGHGVGMCQWGARGRADRGLDYRQILQHYYAGAEVKRIY